MSRGRPVEAETRARIIAALGEPNASRNAIAREFGVAGSTVTAIAREIGHEFERKDTELATAIRTVELQNMRADLAKAFALEAWRALEDMHAPAVMVQFEGSQQATQYGDARAATFHEHILDEPTFSDKRNLMTIAGIAVSKVAELTRAADASGSDDVVSHLEELADSLRTAAVALRNVPASDPTVEPENVSREALIAELEASGATDSDSP